MAIHPQLKVILLSLGKYIMSKFLWKLGKVPCGVSDTTFLAKLQQILCHMISFLQYFSIYVYFLQAIKNTISFPSQKWWKWQWCPLLTILSIWMFPLMQTMCIFFQTRKPSLFIKYCSSLVEEYRFSKTNTILRNIY